MALSLFQCIFCPCEQFHQRISRAEHRRPELPVLAGRLLAWASRLQRSRISPMASLQRRMMWKQSKTMVAFGKACVTISAMLSDRSSCNGVSSMLRCCRCSPRSEPGRTRAPAGPTRESRSSDVCTPAQGCHRPSYRNAPANGP